MILIGEKLNSSIPSTLALFEQKDEAAIRSLITKQEQAGAAYLDINTAICGENELDRMLWAVEQVLGHSSCGIMLDTTDSAVMQQAVDAVLRGRDCPLLLNSATIDDRFDTVVSLAHKANAGVVGMPIDADGMPHTLEEKCQKIDLLMKKLRAAKIPDTKIYLDVLVETLATGGESAKVVLDTIRYVAQKYPQVNTTCGLSNVSFGLPKRALVNSSFAAAAFAAGLSSAILDPTSPSMRGTLAAMQAILGQDEYCMDYITYIRDLEEL
ncbi:MAG: dihydropteroate synthase [Anaerotruncus sp.]|nr:dihydropteroate synthase [Anaerotruncus sp.]